MKLLIYMKFNRIVVLLEDIRLEIYLKNDNRLGNPYDYPSMI